MIRSKRGEPQRGPLRGLPATAELPLAPIPIPAPLFVFPTFLGLFSVVFTSFLLSQIIPVSRGGHGTSKLVRVLTLSQREKNICCARCRCLGVLPAIPSPPQVPSRSCSLGNCWDLENLEICRAMGGDLTPGAQHALRKPVRTVHPLIQNQPILGEPGLRTETLKGS